MRKVDVSEFLPGRKQRPQDQSACHAPKGSSYNAFLGFAVTDATAVLLQRVKRLLTGTDDRSPRRRYSSPPAPSPGVVVHPNPDPLDQKPHCSAFGDLPVVSGSTKVTFRN